MRDYAAIIEIGSGAVRFVVYDARDRAPVKIHAERVLCALGADISKTGRLHPENAAKALEALRRFAGLARAMQVKKLNVVATAAVRDAKDGPAFVARVKKECGLRVETVTGAREARLSALGAFANGFGGDGVIGDYGGGSMELVFFEKGKIRRSVSLPLGSQRLQALAGKDERNEEISRRLGALSFLKKYAGREFCALGGAWRLIGKAHIQMTDYPLPVIDRYALDGRKAVAFCDRLSRRSAAALEEETGFSKKRAEDVQVASLALARVLQALKSRRLVFSGAGLREGVLFDSLPPARQREDALLAGCRKFALKWGRFGTLRPYAALYKRMLPLLKNQKGEVPRWAEASCLLSDAAFLEQEDLQAAHAFTRVFSLPLYAIDHPGRAFLALAVHARYGGAADDEIIAPALGLLDARLSAFAVKLGEAQRAAWLSTGGAF